MRELRVRQETCHVAVLDFVANHHSHSIEVQNFQTFAFPSLFELSIILFFFVFCWIIEES